MKDNNKLEVDMYQCPCGNDIILTCKIKSNNQFMLKCLNSECNKMGFIKDSEFYWTSDERD